MTEQPTKSVLENPYAFIPIDFGNYYGSSYILNATLRAIGNAQPVAIELIGYLGMGKTSLLRYLVYPGVIERFTDYYQPPYDIEPYLIFPIFVDFPVKPKRIHPIQYIYQSFLDAYSRYYNYTKRTYFDKISLSELQLDSSFEPVSSEDLVKLIQKLLGELQRLNSKGIRTVFLFDDFHLVFSDISHELVDQLRYWRNYASFVISSEKSLYDIDTIASKFFGATNIHRISGLNKDEMETLLTKPLERSLVKFPEEDKIFLMSLAGNHTSSLILAARLLWDIRQQYGLLNQSTIPITGNQQTEMKRKLLLRLDRKLTFNWESLSAEEREIVDALASGQTFIFDSSKLASVNLVQMGIAVIDNIGNNAYLRLYSDLLKEFLLDKGNFSLTETEVRLYEFFKNRINEDLTFQTIFCGIWPDEKYEEKDKRRVQVNVSRLRLKLNQSVDDIINVREKGYRFEVKGKTNTYTKSNGSYGNNP